MIYFNSEDRGSESASFATSGATSPQQEKNSNNPEVINDGLDKQNQSISDTKFAISLFSSLTDNSPKTKHYSWSELCFSFSKHKTAEKKNSVSTWSPCQYKTGGMRGNKHVELITLAVLDVDNGLAIDQLLPRIQGTACIIHSSYSHTPKLPKYRVIIPLVQPIAVNAWSQAWSRINAWVGGVNDPATKDAARTYFIPSCPPGSIHQFTQVIDGHFLDFDLLPEVIDEAGSSKPNPIVKMANTSTNEVERDFNERGSRRELKEVQERCHFIQWSCEPGNQPLVIEPLWAAALSNLGRFEGGIEAAHEGSKHHPEYDEDATERKLKRMVSGAGPITCKRIQSLGFDQCPSGGCNLRSGKVTGSPMGLRTWASSVEQAEANTAIGLSENPGLPTDLYKFLHKFYPYGLTFIKGSFYGYRDGYWPRLEEQAEIRKLIAQMYGKSAVPKQINELLTLCKDFQAEKEENVEPNRQLVCLANGTLDVENGQLLANNPSYHLRTRTDIVWDAEAKCERWLKFLDEIFVNDHDKAEKIGFLQMWFGYCLVPDNTQHKFLWLIGAGGNGKSVLLDVLRALLGNQNVSDAHIERLGEKFVRAELEGKLVNISPEMGADATIADGYLKAIVSGDVLEAERKYMPSFSFRPFVRLIASTNNLPRLLDLTNGFDRRAIIMSFNRVFTSEEADKGLVPALLNELPGILAWSVTGLKLLREKKSFALPSSSEQIIAKYKHESDSVSLFAKECLAAEPGKGGMTPTEVYEGFKLWSRANGYGQLNLINFGKRLSALKFKQHRSGGSTYWDLRPIGEAIYWRHNVRERFQNIDKEAEQSAAAEAAMKKLNIQL